MMAASLDNACEKIATGWNHFRGYGEETLIRLHDVSIPAFSKAPALALAVMLVFYFAVNSYVGKEKYKLPKAVPGIPIFGNSFQIPALQQGPWAKQLAEQYGEM